MICSSSQTRRRLWVLVWLGLRVEAELASSRRLELPYEKVREAVLQGDFFRANGLEITKDTKEKKALQYTYEHPRGGPTCEIHRVAIDNGRRFVVDVEASSPKVPFGDAFLTCVRISLLRHSNVCDLSTSCRVNWLRPPRFNPLKHRIETAAEKGTMDAYDTFAYWLTHRFEKEKKKPTLFHKGQTVALCCFFATAAAYTCDAFGHIARGLESVLSTSKHHAAFPPAPNYGRLLMSS